MRARSVAGEDDDVDEMVQLRDVNGLEHSDISGDNGRILGHQHGPLQNLFGSRFAGRFYDDARGDLTEDLSVLQKARFVDHPE
ncbi:hypothetical protein QR680_007495 [Steinernema hermaphroditum]|uniref:Uncharacterized protein n=1 Tax=Steinernema hermaphroditum TaxID=289476 RepID=A0AA39IDB7_9BILA|nr:hypothetical protein QR680_007495 [Steinernema hermaphroditum]